MPCFLKSVCIWKWCSPKEHDLYIGKMNDHDDQTFFWGYLTYSQTNPSKPGLQMWKRVKIPPSTCSCNEVRLCPLRIDVAMVGKGSLGEGTPLTLELTWGPGTKQIQYKYSIQKWETIITHMFPAFFSDLFYEVWRDHDNCFILDQALQKHSNSFRRFKLD